MEKITLKPIVKELLYKNDEPGICFDILSYGGSSTQEKNLGSIYVLSQLKQKEEELDYLVSLTSSLAKREYYSQESLIEQNPKAAFERTLKKLNEVLDDFFANKNLTLNLGLAIIAGDTVYISRLGKFKVAMARDGEYIDILNNIHLFNKDDGDEKQFANIISGKLRAGDKIFAYFPQRAITSREKLLNPIFINQGQEEFSNKIAQLAANASNFSCCGLHIDIKEIKEIPVQTTSTNYQTPINNQIQSAFESIENEKTRVLVSPDLPNTDNNIPKPMATPSVIKSEVSFTKRGNLITNTFGKISQLIRFNLVGRPRLTQIGKLKSIKIGEISKNGKYKFFIITAIIIILPLVGWSFIKNRSSAQVKAILDKAAESLSQARSHSDQNNLKEARTSLNIALAQISNIDSKYTIVLKSDIDKTFNIIDHVSDKEPELLYNSDGNDLKFRQIGYIPNQASIVNENGNLFFLDSGKLNEAGQFKKFGKFLYPGKNYVALFDGINNFQVYDIKTQKISAYSFSNQNEYEDATIYENNLYTLKSGKIEKYNDAIIGGIKVTNWGDVSDSGSIIALAIDGNVYILNSDGKIFKYFRGRKESEIDLQTKPSLTARIKTGKDSPFIYLVEKENKKVFIFDKTSGVLKISYKLDVVGDVQDISINPNGTILILSKTNNIWQIKP